MLNFGGRGNEWYVKLSNSQTVQYPLKIFEAVVVSSISCAGSYGFLNIVSWSSSASEIITNYPSVVRRVRYLTGNLSSSGH